MKRIAASMMAMTAGWAAMNLGLLLIFLAAGHIEWSVSGINSAVLSATPWLMVSAYVVAGAWLVVYLPVFALVPRRSGFWRWTVCVPLGTIVGAVVPFGFWAIPSALVDGSVETLAFLLLPATVGAVAAIVGRLLVDWSRDYRDVPERIYWKDYRELRWKSPGW